MNLSLLQFGTGTAAELKYGDKGASILGGNRGKIQLMVHPVWVDLHFGSALTFPLLFCHPLQLCLWDNAGS